MARDLIVNGVTYAYPDAGESPGWGEVSTDWAEAVTNALAASSSAGDILPSTANILDNQSTAQNVVGLVFSTSVTQGAIVQFLIVRSNNPSPTIKKVESGNLYITYNSLAASWELSQISVGTSGVTFSITATGQIKYISDSVGGSSNYSGKIKFKASSLGI